MKRVLGKYQSGTRVHQEIERYNSPTGNICLKCYKYVAKKSKVVSSSPHLIPAKNISLQKGMVYIAQRASWEREAYMIIRYSMGSFYHANGSRVSAARSELSINEFGFASHNSDIKHYETQFERMYPDKKLYT